MTTQQRQRMDTLQIAGLIVLCGGLLFLGVISVVNQVSWEEPDDGITWERRGGVVVAADVDPRGAGARAGVRAGDELVGLDGHAPAGPEAVEAMLYARDVGERVDLTLRRSGGDLEAFLVVDGVAPSVDRGTYYYLAFVGLCFLVVGVLALLRQPEGASRRFFWLALGFYALLALSPTTRTSDPWHSAIFWLDQVARDLTPGLFLWFALTFPRPKRELEGSRDAILVSVFAPGVLLFLLAWSLVSTSWITASQQVKARLFEVGARIELVYLGVAVALGVAALVHTYRHAATPLERKRMKWLVGGVTLGLAPFVAIYLPMAVLGISYEPLANLSVVPLAVLPLAFGYAAVGFRLWDVEIILKKATIYLVASVASLGLYLTARWLLAGLFGPDDGFVQTASLGAILLVALLFGPLRDWLQDVADRMYYKERYRARRTLTSFARELNSEVDLGQVVELLVGRVRDTLGVGRVAVLLRVEESDHLRFVGVDGDIRSGRRLSSHFSQFVAGALSKREFLYVDDLAGLEDEYPDDLELLEEENVAYFLPLEVKGDVIGVLGLGRKLSGDYLSSDDLKVLQPLAAHAALAIDNALLYREAERRAVELERLKEYSENIVESIKGGVMVLDADGTVVSWNRSLAEMYGVSTDDVVGRPVSSVFPSSFLKVLEEAREKVERGLEPMTSAYRIPLRTRNGDERVVTLSLAPLLGQGDDGGGTVIIVDDVTERTELESQLRQAEKLTSVGLLAAGVAHEVNTPLAGISSYVQMLQRKLPDTDPRRAILEKIEKQTFRASQIVNNLLNFSRQETGEFRDVDLNDVVEEAMTLAEIQLRKRDIQVQLDLAEDSEPLVHGDPIKLQQVITNLVLNARDAMPDGGELRISTRRDGDDAVLEVADTGSGIDTEHIDKVYDPFFTTKGIGKGTGLGLSVSYGIIQEHRGTIRVDSRPGQGTRFRITLPMKHAAGAARVAS